MSYAYMKLAKKKSALLRSYRLQSAMATQKKRKKLQVAEVKSIVQAVKPREDASTDLKEKILNSISKMKQLAVFPERQQLFSMLTRADVRPTYDKLVSSLLEDYLKLFYQRQSQVSGFSGSLVGPHQKGR